MTAAYEFVAPKCKCQAAPREPDSELHRALTLTSRNQLAVDPIATISLTSAAKGDGTAPEFSHRRIPTTFPGNADKSDWSRSLGQLQCLSFVLFLFPLLLDKLACQQYGDRNTILGITEILAEHLKLRPLTPIMMKRLHSFCLTNPR